MTKVANNKKPYTIHKTDVILNKEALKDVLDRQGMEYIQLYEKAKEKYGLDMTYKGFMSLASNRSAWKLIYAWAIADVLHVDIKDIFNKVDVDVEAKIREKEEWNKNYGKNKGK
jgi:hypothetical protein